MYFLKKILSTLPVSLCLSLSLQVILIPAWFDPVFNAFNSINVILQTNFHF